MKFAPFASILCGVLAGGLPARAGDLVWSGTVSVTADVEVAPETTLRIEAGARIELAASVSIRVRGRLLAEGTEAAPILFTRRTAGTRWERILFIDSGDSRLEHCVIEFADSAGDHQDYYDTRDADCEPLAQPPARDYHEAVVVISSHVDFESCRFRNLPDAGTQAEGDAIAIISDDIENPGEASANIRNCRFESIGQGIHTRYSHVLVEDCFFTGHRGDNDDIDLYGESTPPPLIVNNIFLDPQHDDMINPTRCSAMIVGNVVAGSDDHGIVLRDRCDPVVMNNVIYDCSSAGISAQNSCNALLVNNTIADCGRGVRFFDHTDRWGLPYCLTPGSGRATMVNCVIWNCPTSLELADSPYEPDPGAHVTLSYCDVQGGAARVVRGSASTVTWGEGNIDADPLFVDAAGGDFHVAETSPLVDAGTAAGAPDHDIDGNARPCGKEVDIGATEYGGCGSVPEARFLRGDVNADGILDISDPILLLFGLFLDATLPCEKSADADDTGELNLADALDVLNYLFLAGAPPPDPGLACGTDPTGDDLTCASYDACP